MKSHVADRIEREVRGLRLARLAFALTVTLAGTFGGAIHEWLDPHVWCPKHHAMEDGDRDQQPGAPGMPHEHQHHLCGLANNAQPLASIAVAPPVFVVLGVSTSSRPVVVAPIVVARHLFRLAPKTSPPLAA